MIDYHMHLENGPLTLEWLERFWQIAEKRGITEIGITEHCHKFREFYPMFKHLTRGEGSYQFMRDWIAADFKINLDQYIELLLSARSQRIPVKIGLELDYLPGTESFAQKLISQYPFDFVLGSVHVIDKWGFDYAPEVWDNQDTDQAYRGYYEVLSSAVDSGLFDIAAHFDLIKVFGHRTDTRFTDHVCQILEKMARNQLSLELSSAGLRKPVGEIYPADWILQRAGELEIPITFASDAHYPEDVGADFDQLLKAANRCGVSVYSIYSNRMRTTKAIEFDSASS